MAWVREMKAWASTDDANASKLTAACTAKVQTELATMHTVCKTISSSAQQGPISGRSFLVRRDGVLSQD